jgi:outer membrane protein assembly factor BamB
MRFWRLTVIVVGVALLAAACDWQQVRFGPERTGYSPFEAALSPSNVGRLTEQWTAGLIGAGSDPVVADGHVYVTASTPNPATTITTPTPIGYLYTFDANGRTNCGGSPSTCSPVWSAPYLSANSSGVPLNQFLSAPAVDNGTVYIETLQTEPEDIGLGSTDAYKADSGTQVFSENGSNTVSRLAFEGGTMAPAVSGGTLYGSFDFLPGRSEPFGGLDALDPSTGSPRFFAGLSLPLAGPYSAPTVANGILYAASGNTLSAFDATGNTDCGPGPGVTASLTVCQPLWSATTSAPMVGSLQPTTGEPPLTAGVSYLAVANGYVYVGDASGTLSAFPAGGCGAASCSPAWTAQTGGAINSSAAVTPTTVFVGSDDGKLYAFPARGCGAATCQPAWTATTGGAVRSSPSVAGRVVYVGSDDGHLYAFNASGCGNTSCGPSLNVNLGPPVDTSPAISNGKVFVTDTAGTLHVLGLPTP